MWRVIRSVAVYSQRSEDSQRSQLLFWKCSDCNQPLPNLWSAERSSPAGIFFSRIRAERSVPAQGVFFRDKCALLL